MSVNDALPQAGGSEVLNYNVFSIAALFGRSRETAFAVTTKVLKIAPVGSST